MKAPLEDTGDFAQNFLVVKNLEDFEMIYRAYWEALFNYAFKRIRSAEKTEEMIQDLFADLWEKREQIQIKQSIQTYLFTSLKHRILNYLRDELVRNGHLQHIKTSSPAWVNAVEEQMNFAELEKALNQGISNLPEKCREVFLLSRQENLSFREISEKLHISVNTVEKHMGKALKVLRSQLKDFASLLILLMLGN